MKKRNLFLTTTLVVLCTFATTLLEAKPPKGTAPNGLSAKLDKKNITKVANAAFDWEVEAYHVNKWDMDVRDWRAGTLYNGMFAWGKVAQSPKVFDFLTQVFDTIQWQVGDRKYNADDISVSQTYLDMYAKYKQDQMIAPTKQRLDWIMDNPPTPNIDISKGKSTRWWWCDALFMAPPVYARMTAVTGDERYMGYAHQEFVATYEHLYSPQYQLFFRDGRYLDKKEANGEPMFWSRGNGWVMVGLVGILQQLPKEDTKYRPFYETLFKEMANKLLSLQRKDGSWSSGLLDSEAFPEPETSGTGLIAFSLAYGVNEGLLDKKTYMPAVQKSWQTLVYAMDSDGRVGWVQLVAQAPGKVKRADTQVYGAGAVLMLASELYKMAK